MTIFLLFVFVSVVVFFVICRAAEILRPDRDLPQVGSWKIRVTAMTVLELAAVVLLGLVFKDWWAFPSILEWGDTLSPLVGGAVAYACASFVFYWWHRARHQSDLLWRIFHQVHHSPQRLETITTFYKHPAEVVSNSVLSAVITYLVCGLSIEGAAVYTAITIGAQFFVHTNVRTPRWLGYFYQRPEMHRLHHAKDRHLNNYSDIVWWDMLFGTYENPETFSARCGFDEEREERLLDMLVFYDVHREMSK
jgi:sterol desaturase/sphingolipid hydroxylase (fatty acid hydroxylase superfamily)